MRAEYASLPRSVASKGSREGVEARYASAPHPDPSPLFQRGEGRGDLVKLRLVKLSLVKLSLVKLRLVKLSLVKLRLDKLRLVKRGLIELGLVKRCDFEAYQLDWSNPL